MIKQDYTPATTGSMVINRQLNTFFTEEMMEQKFELARQGKFYLCNIIIEEVIRQYHTKIAREFKERAIDLIQHNPANGESEEAVSSDFLIYVSDLRRSDIVGMIENASRYPGADY